jgi:hypothetical protein
VTLLSQIFFRSLILCLLWGSAAQSGVNRKEAEKQRNEKSLRPLRLSGEIEPNRQARQGRKEMEML